jgi:SulP family sulfate permease
MTRIYHKPNKELVGQGIGNIITGLFGGIAGSGATMRTGVNIRAGGRTPISGMFHAAILLALVLGLAPLAEHIPHAVLAGILLRVGYDIIDWNFIKKFSTAPRFNIFLMLLVIILTVGVDLITAVMVGVALAALHLVKSLADSQLQLMQPVHHTSVITPVNAAEKALMQKHDGKIIVYRLQGPLSFGGATTMARILGSFDMYDALFLDLSGVYYIDTTSVMAIEDIITQANETRKKIYLVGLLGGAKTAFESHQTLGLLPENHICPDLGQALLDFDRNQ